MKSCISAVLKKSLTNMFQHDKEEQGKNYEHVLAFFVSKCIVLEVQINLKIML